MKRFLMFLGMIGSIAFLFFALAGVILLRAVRV